MNRNVSVGVLIPSLNTWDTDFAMCLLELFNHTMMTPVPGIKRLALKVFNQRGSILPLQRYNLVQNALKTGCDYGLFIDNDQTFPHDTLQRLLAHEKRVVACNIATKKIPSSPTARKYNAKWPLGEVVYTDPDSTGLEEVWRIGCGIMLIDLKVFRKLPKPWFMNRYDERHDQIVGEDWYFCELLEKVGTKIYIDHDLSKEIGHIGPYTYTHDVVGEVVQKQVEGQAPVKKGLLQFLRKLKG